MKKSSKSKKIMNKIKIKKQIIKENIIKNKLKNNIKCLKLKITFFSFNLMI